MNYLNKKLLVAAMSGIMALPACTNDDESPASAVELKDHSVTPALVKTLPGFENLKIHSLISSDDQLPQSPAFMYGPQPDGAGLMRNTTGEGYVLITNHEINRSVSRVFLDETFKPTKGEYLVNSIAGMWRLCSATLAMPEEHGFGPTFLTAGESGPESMVHAIDPLAPADPANTTRVKPALGKASMENAVPLPKTAYPGKTVIVIGEDNSEGQLIAYVSNQVGDLDNGKLYVLKRTNDDPVETSMALGSTYEVVFTEIENAKELTGAQIAAQTKDKNAIQFARVEDLDYGKGSPSNNRQVYFAATGISQADKLTPVPGFNMWGRVYKLTMDATDPLKGTLEIIADGSVDPGNNIVNPDNICVTNNFVYIQEDGDSFYKENKHDGIIWQYSIGTKALKPMIIMNHRRDDPAFNAKYNSVGSTNLSSWEYGAMLDISDLVRIPNTFLINIHPHTWQDPKFEAADEAGAVKNKEGGQTVIVTGIPR